jgi:hypothetical protein
MKVIAPLPEAPATTSFLRKSSMLLTPVVCHTAMVSTTGAMVPSQRNLTTSNCTPWPPTAWVAAKLLPSMPI